MDMNMKGGVVYAQNYIDGKLEDCKNYLDSYNPGTGAVWAKIPDSSGDDVNRAAVAAKRAFPSWAALSYAARSAYLFKVADLLEIKTDDFALAESRDQGKPVTLAKNMDINRAILNFRCVCKRA
jgi:acyl-CoA reductase-like NAD-dependent aldehyde dehydrogenase